MTLQTTFGCQPVKPLISGQTLGLWDFGMVPYDSPCHQRRFWTVVPIILKTWTVVPIILKRLREGNKRMSIQLLGDPPFMETATWVSCKFTLSPSDLHLSQRPGAPKNLWTWWQTWAMSGTNSHVRRKIQRRYSTLWLFSIAMENLHILFI